MKLKILLLTALLIPTVAMATGWRVNQHGAALVLDSTRDVMFGVYSSGKVEVVDVSEDCDKSSLEASETALKVNGTFVKFNSYCHSLMGYRTKRPLTEAGKAFILKQFETKTSVKIGIVTFSAIGFTKTLKEQKEFLEASKTAL